MVEKRNPITVEDAIKRVMKYRKTGEIEYIDIKQANGRILASDIIADHDVPAFNRSPYDGYAIKSSDTSNASTDNPVVFRVVGHIGAGSVFQDTVKEKEAVRIMTGAAIPDGADTVIMLEDTETLDNDQVAVKKQMENLQNISLAGEDVKKNTVIVPKGKIINPGIVALLATFGYKNVPVSKKPVIGVIATGSELLEVDEELQDGKIRNSNSYMMIAQIERAGAIAKYFGQFSDQLDTCIEQMKSAMTEVDFLITTGGVSVGDFDLLPDIYKHFQANVLFNKIRMRPGSVTTVAELDGQLLFGLSGNPSACYVGFELFVKPVIDTFVGRNQVGMKKAKATLSVPFTKANPFDRFIRGHYELTGGKVEVSPSGKDKSNMVHSLAEANCFIHLPGGTNGYNKGETVEICLLENV
ncbi:molybdopterin molybdotransferase [Gracilibacillus ureilyticus]|uniref:Molybdopterin molybdenumtransferase n=1 Tax=Gracilibacillus ureilyticus TaxID=531814 RepID=A0A1H9S079_9BACI|nr:gephyrin-like molybdotransferase Glp [Gracilibacillus ureilyticus]SER78456.1 molybdopterin molybdotransferase [Gracilibacillus ureilyticus]